MASDAAIRRALAADGFVRIPQFFTPTETAEIEHALQTYMQSAMLAAPGGFDGHNYSCEVEGDLSTVWRISGINSEPLPALGRGRLPELFSLAVGAAAGAALRADPQSGDLQQALAGAVAGRDPTPTAS